jgi:hypothetical protein
MNDEMKFAVIMLLCCGAAMFYAVARTSDHEERVCRHTIQHNFAKSSEEAQALIEETRQWESK